MIEEQSNGTQQGDHELEFKAWSDRLDNLDRKRGGYLDLAAETIMDRDELRTKLAEIRESREVAERELAVLEGRMRRIQQLEQDRETIIENYMGMTPEALDLLRPEKRYQSRLCMAIRTCRK
jgi:hypothetical protein